MSSKKKQAELREEKEWENIDKAVVKSGNFLEKNSKQILIVLGVFVIIACGYLAYDNFYAGPRGEDAKVASFKGQEYFTMRQDSLALFGDGNGYIGFKTIAEEYGSTKAGNLAKAYAGICFANLGQYENAISFLKDYSGNGDTFSYIAKGTLGDCLDNLGKTDEALSNYEAAAKGADNLLYSPIFYKKAAEIYLKQEKFDKVIEVFKLVKDKYASSPLVMGGEADKYIEIATALKAGK